MASESQRQRAEALIRKYLDGTATPDERAEVESGYLQYHDRQSAGYERPNLVDAKRRLDRRLHRYIRSPRVLPRVAVAAAVLLAVCSAAFYLYKAVEPASRTTESRYGGDVQPGGEGAMLTLSDGRQIPIDDQPDSLITRDLGIAISKTAGGELTYAAASGTGASAGHNTLSTARGQTYRVRLPDGSIVRLNAGSSLSYPLSFGLAGPRVVSVAGEAFFDVAHDADRPFVVNVAGQQVEVLGTEFNVHAYPEVGEARTTLLSGRVRVSAAGTTAELAPGEEAVLAGDNLHKQPANLGDALAWINGDFNFEAEEIEDIMQKLARWYDIDVTYQGDRPTARFYGKVSRRKPLSDVLHVLESAGGVHFKITGKEVTVMQ